MGEAPNLLLGLAGIGYFFLRLHNPVDVPSVLLLGAPAGANDEHMGNRETRRVAA